MNLPVQRALAEEKRGRELTLLFLFWPFLSFILAVRNFKSEYSRKVIIAFFAFFGFTLSLEREGMDGYRHAEKFKDFSDLNFSDFLDLLSDFFTNTTNAKTLDIYSTVTNFIVSRFTDSYNFIFLFHGFIFAFFMIKLFGILYDESKGLNKNSLIFFIFLFFLLPISNIQAIRFPIATIIFVYGAYTYLSTEKWRCLLWCVASCLVHFSFFSVFALIVAYHFLGNRNYLYLGFIALSFAIPNLFTTYLKGFEDSGIGESVEGKIAGYSREGYIQARKDAIQDRNWYVRLRIPLLQYTMYFVLILINYYKKTQFKHDKTQQNLFSFMLLLLAFVNFGFALDSLGGRFLLVWLIFAGIYMFRFFQLNYYPSYHRYTFILAFPIILWIVVQTRVAMYITSYMWFIGNPFFAYFVKMKPIFN